MLHRLYADRENKVWEMRVSRSEYFNVLLWLHILLEQMNETPDGYFCPQHPTECRSSVASILHPHSIGCRLKSRSGYWLSSLIFSWFSSVPPDIPRGSNLHYVSTILSSFLFNASFTSQFSIRPHII
jgi:hypothetical protein